MVQAKELDPNFRNQVLSLPGGENLLRCYACGDCTASCPVRGIDERFNPRRIIRMAVLGLKERVLRSDFVWLCSTCYSCHERCPQGVKIPEIMALLKNLAVREGYIHPSFKKQAQLVRDMGRLYEIEDFDNKRRQRLGLPPVKKVVDEVREIFRRTGAMRFLE
ncbi:heterodisulfide reductase [candidate division TA06 bacterium DG_26]|uniref:Heterodisulfide reductase n=1 Tax=candidate division TA06 bacterium DG_26 TaxID=1703771 RepID=A0A0S7WKE6_UNCT6|nr:MAG: heterodisulfide reductase [candidate division TA06 bacterium DG_26]